MCYTDYTLQVCLHDSSRAILESEMSPKPETTVGSDAGRADCSTFSARATVCSR
jgi:hypothetical protein